MTEKLTPGEQAIYAAVFAADVTPIFKPCGVPLHVLKDGTEDAWRSRQAVTAAEVAWAVIEAFREAGPGVAEAFGKDNDVHAMWRDLKDG